MDDDIDLRDETIDDLAAYARAARSMCHTLLDLLLGAKSGVNLDAILVALDASEDEDEDEDDATEAPTAH